MSFVLYAMHGVLAVKVYFFVKKEQAEKRERIANDPSSVELSTLSPEQIERARRLWRNQGRYEL